ncbi:hypothetical protein GOQ27_01890 [Clostridium sp. D2Q-11]|uniref:DRTGG domain-containing protein n=1 Tax=Anaeromonas frigoriresistens TaxID=2683708 RepID=A0A942URE7_9FIRM|nr:DRTGG domain-containing protein [Anaeromonas frigoriresistens]MBS4537193.1 hypothetical protein [Anaeromonas frigoriresistens]
MKLKEIQKLLDAKVVTGEEYLDKEVYSAFGSDLMSDVLAYVDESAVLLTGLNNPQIIRTAEMIDLFAIILVRGKTPGEDLVGLAKDKNITLMTTNHILYTASGLLYGEGLKGVDING